MTDIHKDHLNQNLDLIWDLTTFRQRVNAANFIKGFENKFCVFSGSVNQLYTNYSINFISTNPKKIIFLPDPYCYHDTFNSVPESAVIPTGIKIIYAGDKTEPTICIPYQAGGRRCHSLPLRVGLTLLSKNKPRNDPFLPVLSKGDLRETDLSTPYLELHRIIMPALDRMALFERNGIFKSISEKLKSI